jgi:5'-nucleotidase
MKILLTNDDGWDAPGLEVLKEVVHQAGEIWTVAPEHPMSGISHQITFEQPMRLTERGERSFSLTGTPADCVRIAVSQLNVKFDWVFSGINNGANLGSDIYVSGTVAATREAVLHGCRSVAFSQHRRKFKQAFDWTETKKMAQHFLKELLSSESIFEDAPAFNVNFPDQFHLVEGRQLQPQPQLVQCPIDANPLPTDFKRDEDGNYIYCSQYEDRLRSPDCDIDICFGGSVAVSPFRF